MGERERRRFERLVGRSLRSLPPYFRQCLRNVAIVVEEEPDPEDLQRMGIPPGQTLFGLYLGIPQTERSSSYGLVLPDRIAIYRRPLEEACATERDLVREVRLTVAHEVAHHFGLSDEDLHRLGRARRSRPRQGGTMMSQADEVPRAAVRPSIIAGSWYPADPQDLARTIDSLLAAASPAEPLGELLGLVVPHAGIVYSGPVAAHAYRQLADLPPESVCDRVVLIGPSHHPYEAQLLVSDRGYYQTPLGMVEIDRPFLVRVLERTSPLRVQRVADDREHSLEIQLPFLQRVLPSFRLVPLMMADQTLPACRALAESLVAVLKDAPALLIATTDLSHYHDYAEAQALDRAVLDDITRLDPDGLARDVAVGKGEACGAGPVATLLLAARALGATQARVLARANSGDITGDRDRVVGYGAAAIWR